MNGSGSTTANRSASVTARRYPAARLAAPPASFQPRNAATRFGRRRSGSCSMCTKSTPAVWHTPGPVAPDGRYTSAVSAIDLLVIGAVGLSAFRGAQRGLVATLLGLAGFAVGALIGSRVAPLLLSGGRHSPWLGAAGLLDALARFDPLPVVPSIADRALDRPDPSVPRGPGPRAAEASVVRVQGTACGLGI